jgi:NAD+ kinase
MKIGIIANEEPYYQKQARKIIELLKKKKMNFKINKRAKFDVIIVAGGDGTVFKAVKEYPASVLPLKNLKPSDMERMLDKIKKGKYITEKMTRLEVRYKNIKRWGINDISVLRDDESANRFKVFIDGKDAFKDELIGDGVIISTPYGSSAYNWSAGGMVVNGKKVAITPVCSTYSSKRHMIKNRIVKKRIEKSIIVPDNKEIVVKFTRGLRNKIVPDGRKEERFYINAKTGDKILIRKSKEYSKFVRIL